MTREIASVFVAGVALISALGSACTHLTPPVRNGGPTRSSEGVELAVARKSCDQVQEPGWYGDDLAELKLDVAVRNPAPAPLIIHRANLRLLVPDGGALRTVTWRSADPFPVAPGETKTFEIRFMTRGSLQCGANLQLDTRGAVTVDDRPLATGRISFTPSPRPDSL